jgi:hypothetical protein
MKSRAGDRVWTMMQGFGGVRSERNGGYAEHATVSASAVASLRHGGAYCNRLCATPGVVPRERNQCRATPGVVPRERNQCRATPGVVPRERNQCRATSGVVPRDRNRRRATPGVALR